MPRAALARGRADDDGPPARQATPTPRSPGAGLSPGSLRASPIVRAGCRRARGADGHTERGRALARRAWGQGGSAPDRQTRPPGGVPSFAAGLAAGLVARERRRYAREMASTSRATMLSETSFEMAPGTRTTFGRGAVGKLGKRIKSMGRSSAFIVTDPGLVKHGVVAQVVASLEAAGIGSAVFDGIAANPSADAVTAGGALLHERPDDVVIAVGGGSAMDAAKAIAILGPNGGKITDYPFGCRPAKAPHAVVAVPTTAGTGSETNMFGVVTEPSLGRKVLVGHPGLTPVAVILDPLLTVGAPPGVTATCGIDVLTHAIEALTCNRANPYSDSLALRAISMAATHLPAAFDNGADLEARAQMLLAAHLAGIAFTNSGLGMCHAMGHPLSARLGAAHGQALATLLPLVMRFNKSTCADRYAQVAIAMGAADPALDDAANADRAIAAIEAMRARVNTDRTGTELGIDASLVSTLVEDAFADPLMAATPRMPEPADVTTIYEATR